MIGGGGFFNKRGRATPMLNFFLALVDHRGVSVECHGDSTGKFAVA
jgi:hypothetical protein